MTHKPLSEQVITMFNIYIDLNNLSVHKVSWWEAQRFIVGEVGRVEILPRMASAAPCRVNSMAGKRTAS